MVSEIIYSRVNIKIFFWVHSQANTYNRKSLIKKNEFKQKSSHT